MKKVIVTGGLGFIGSNLIKLLLKKNYFVVNIDKISYSSNIYNTKDFRNNKNYKFIKLDINNRKLFNIRGRRVRPPDDYHRRRVRPPDDYHRRRVRLPDEYHRRRVRLPDDYHRRHVRLPDIRPTALPPYRPTALPPYRPTALPTQTRD